MCFVCDQVTTVYGIPADYAALVAIIINDQPPYDCSVGILDTEIWALNGPDKVYLELRDANDIGGNVTVSISRSDCDKAAAIDGDVSGRQSLKPAQVSFILQSEDFSVQTIKVLTEKMYSTFNGLGSVKSIEFVGKRDMKDSPESSQALAERRDIEIRRRRRDLRPKKKIPEELFNFLPHRLLRPHDEPAFVPRKRQNEDAPEEPVMVDMVVTMYELDLLPGDDVELDLQMFKGAKAAADILTTTESIIIETAVPIVPNPIDAGMILGIVLTSIGESSVRESYFQ